MEDGPLSPQEPFRDLRSSTESSTSTSSSSSITAPKEARDIESQSPQTTAAAEHYVSVRSKLVFLAAYFFLNLFLTLSNKSVLGTVSMLIRINKCRTYADSKIGEVSLAPYCSPLFSDLNRLFCHVRLWRSQTVHARYARKSDSGRLLVSVHDQHCDIERIAGDGVSAVPPNYAIYDASHHDSHLQIRIRQDLFRSDLSHHGTTDIRCGAGNSGGLLCDSSWLHNDFARSCSGKCCPPRDPVRYVLITRRHRSRQLPRIGS